MNRIDRLSAIMIMLQSSTSVKVKQITQRFDISSRTVYRDLRALEEAGIPLSGDSRTGYSIIEGFKLPPLMFTQQEAFTFIAAERIIDKFTDKGFIANYKAGIEKIKAVMKLAEIKDIEDIDNKIGILNFHVPKPDENQNVLHKLIDNATKKRKLKLTYYSYNSQQTSVRLIEPVGIFFSLSNWYLIAYCNNANEYRTFRVNRIHSLTETDQEFKTNHPSLDSFLQSLEKHDELQKVILEISKDNLLLLDENRYYQGLISEQEKNGNVEMHFMTYSLERFARWYMSYMDMIKVIYPDELKNAVKSIIGKSAL